MAASSAIAAHGHGQVRDLYAHGALVDKREVATRANPEPSTPSPPTHSSHPPDAYTQIFARASSIKAVAP